MLFEHDPANYAVGRLLGIFAVGLVYDLAATTYVLLPFALLITFFSNGRIGRAIHGIAICALVPSSPTWI